MNSDISNERNLNQRLNNKRPVELITEHGHDLTLKSMESTFNIKKMLISWACSSSAFSVGVEELQRRERERKGGEQGGGEGGVNRSTR